MDQQKWLYFEFFDSDNNIRSIAIKNPAEDVSLEAATAVANVIIEKDVLRTVTGASYVSVSNIYYKTITKVPLVAEAAE